MIPNLQNLRLYRYDLQSIARIVDVKLYDKRVSISTIASNLGEIINQICIPSKCLQRTEPATVHEACQHQP